VAKTRKTTRGDLSIIFRGLSLAFGFWFAFRLIVGYEDFWLSTYLFFISVYFWSIAKLLEN
jgi:hypothetical protein